MTYELLTCPAMFIKKSVYHLVKNPASADAPPYIFMIHLILSSLLHLGLNVAASLNILYIKYTSNRGQFSTPLQNHEPVIVRNV
jgi:hypothetical protein